MNRFTTLIVLLIAGVCFTACEKRQAKQQSGTGGATKVVFVPKSMGIAYYEKMYPEFKRACTELGAEFNVVGPAKTDATSQIPIIKDQVQLGVNVILLAPNSADALNPDLDAARARAASRSGLSASAELGASRITFTPCCTWSLMIGIWLVASVFAGPTTSNSAPSSVHARLNSGYIFS